MKFKKVISLLLVLVMVISMMPLSVFATQEGPIDGTESTESIEEAVDPMSGKEEESPAPSAVQEDEEKQTEEQPEETENDSDENQEGNQEENQPAEDVLVESITITYDGSTELVVGESIQLTVTVLPENATDNTLSWESDNTSVLTVDQNGNVTAEGVGTATITAAATDGSGVSCCFGEITVASENQETAESEDVEMPLMTMVNNSVPVEQVYFNHTEDFDNMLDGIKVGDSINLSENLIISPDTATDKTVSWKSSNTSVITVGSDGKAKAVGPGLADITVTANDGSGAGALLSLYVPSIDEGLYYVPNAIYVMDDDFSNLGTFIDAEIDSFIVLATYEMHGYDSSIKEIDSIVFPEDNLVISDTEGLISFELQKNPLIDTDEETGTTYVAAVYDCTINNPGYTTISAYIEKNDYVLGESDLCLGEIELGIDRNILTDKYFSNPKLLNVLRNNYDGIISYYDAMYMDGDYYYELCLCDKERYYQYDIDNICCDIGLTVNDLKELSEYFTAENLTLIIGDNASEITSLIIGDNLSSVGFNNLANLYLIGSNIESVDLSDSTLSGLAAYNCKQLSSITGCGGLEFLGIDGCPVTQLDYVNITDEENIVLSNINVNVVADIINEGAYVVDFNTVVDDVNKVTIDNIGESCSYEDGKYTFNEKISSFTYTYKVNDSITMPVTAYITEYIEAGNILNSRNFTNPYLLNKLKEKFGNVLSSTDASNKDTLWLCDYTLDDNKVTDSSPVSLYLTDTDIYAILTYFTGLKDLWVMDDTSKVKALDLSSYNLPDAYFEFTLPSLETFKAGNIGGLFLTSCTNLSNLTIDTGTVIGELAVCGGKMPTLAIPETVGCVDLGEGDYPQNISYLSKSYSVNIEDIVGEENADNIVCAYAISADEDGIYNKEEHTIDLKNGQTQFLYLYDVHYSNGEEPEYMYVLVDVVLTDNILTESTFANDKLLTELLDQCGNTLTKEQAAEITNLDLSGELDLTDNDISTVLKYFTGLENITISDTLSTIETLDFSKCASIKNATINLPELYAVKFNKVEGKVSLACPELTDIEVKTGGYINELYINGGRLAVLDADVLGVTELSFGQETQKIEYRNNDIAVSLQDIIGEGYDIDCVTLDNEKYKEGVLSLSKGTTEFSYIYKVTYGDNKTADMSVDVQLNILNKLNFPDETFLNYLNKQYKNGLTREEAAEIMAFPNTPTSESEFLSSEGAVYLCEISSLEGIDYFSGLTSLSLKIGDGKNAEDGTTVNNNINLNLTEFTKLKWLKIYDQWSRISSISLPKSNELELLHLQCLPITGLDLSDYTNLKILHLDSCKNIGTLDLSKNTNLDGGISEDFAYVQIEDCGLNKITLNDEISLIQLNYNKLANMGCIKGLSDNCVVIALEQLIDVSEKITSEGNFVDFSSFDETTLTGMTVKTEGVTIDKESGKVKLDDGIERFTYEYTSSNNVDIKVGDKTYHTPQIQLSAVATIKEIETVSSISLDEDKCALENGNSFKINASVLETEELTAEDIVWSVSDNTGLALSVDDSNKIATVEAQKTGQYTINAAFGDKTASCEITVFESGEINLDTDSINFDLTDNSDAVQLNASIENTDYKDKCEITWASSNENVATVDENGLVTPVENGTCTIKVSSLSNKNGDTCNVTVTTSAADLTLDTTQIGMLSINSTKQIVANVTPDTCTDTVLWASSNEKIATVSEEGVVTAISNGECTITASCGDKTATCEVLVIDANSVSVSLDSDSIVFDMSDDIYDVQLNAKITPDNAVDYFPAVWTSDNENVATVDGNGLVTRKGNGTCKITVTVAEKSASADVTVKTTTTEIQLDKEDLVLRLSDKVKESISATLYPETTTETEVVWESDDENIATVCGGVVAAVAEGTCTVKATCGDHSAECSVTVRGESILTEDNFPDAELLKKLNSIFDSYLSETEADAVKELNLSKSGIKSFDGIELFSNLEKLDISNNLIYYIDLSEEQFPNLTELNADQDLSNYHRFGAYGKRVVISESYDEVKIIDDTHLSNISVNSSVGTYDEEHGIIILNDEPADNSSVEYIYSTGVGNMTVSAGIIKESTLSIIYNVADVSVDAGKSARFYVLAQSTKYQTITYQWQLSKDKGKTFEDIEGETEWELKIESVSSKQHRYQYRCKISDFTYEEVLTNAATLKISGATLILFQPQNYVGHENDLASMSVTSTSTDGENLTYQWFCKEPSAESYIKVEGETESTTYFTLTADNSGSLWYCVITNESGEEVTSETASATISDEIVVGSGDVLASNGDNLTIDVGLSEDIFNIYDVRWQISVDGGTNWADIEGEKEIVLDDIFVADEMNGYMYRCVLNDGSADFPSDPVMINIRGQLKVVKAPENTYNDGCFEMLAAGEGIEYHWKFADYDENHVYNTLLGTSRKTRGYTYGAKLTCYVTDKYGNKSEVYGPVYNIWNNGPECYKQGKRYIDNPVDTTVGIDAPIGLSATINTFWKMKWEYSDDNGSTWSEVPAYEIEIGEKLDGYMRRTSVVKTLSTKEMNGRLYRCTLHDDFNNEMVINPVTLTVDESIKSIVSKTTGLGTLEISSNSDFTDSITYAAPGATVYCRAQGDGMHSALSTLTMNGEEIMQESGICSFIMPECTVNLSAIFKRTYGEICLMGNDLVSGYKGLYIESPAKQEWSANYEVACGDEVTLSIYPEGVQKFYELKKLEIRCYSDKTDVSSHARRAGMTYTLVDYENVTTEEWLEIYKFNIGSSRQIKFIMPEGSVDIYYEYDYIDVSAVADNSKSENGYITIEEKGWDSNLGYEFTITGHTDKGYKLKEYYYLEEGSTEAQKVRNKIADRYSIDSHINTRKSRTVWGIFDKIDYTIDIASAVGSGTASVQVNGVTSTTNKAQVGDVVVVYLTPDAGYRTSDTGVQAKQGTSLTVNKHSASVYQFIMPASDVSLETYFEEYEWDGTVSKPEIIVPDYLEEAVSCTIDDRNNATISIKDSDADAWTKAYENSTDGFITLTVATTAPSGTTQLEGKYINTPYDIDNVPGFESTVYKNSISEGEMLTDKIKIASYYENEDGTITIVPLSDSTVSDMRGTRYAFGDAAGKTTGITVYNLYLEPDVLQAFQIKAQKDYPENITWIGSDDSTNTDVTYSYFDGLLNIQAVSGKFVDEVTVSPNRGSIWDICTISAPDGYTFAEITDTSGENCSTASTDGKTLTISKPVFEPYTLYSINAKTIYTIKWTNGENIKTEKLTVETKGDILYSAYWKPANVKLNVSEETLENNGIVYVYDADTGKFNASVGGKDVPSMESLNAKVTMEIPDGAVYYRCITGYGSNLYSKSFAETQKAVINSQDCILITDGFEASLPLFEITTNKLGGVEYAYSSNLDTRFAVYEFYDSSYNLIDQGSYIVGNAEAFIFGEVTQGVDELSEPVTAPTIVGSDDSLKITYYPQNGNGKTYLMDLKTDAEPGEDGVTIYLPYSCTEYTYEELKGKIITVYHYPDENDPNNVEELQGVCTEYGIRINMKSFSPVVLDWSEVHFHTLQHVQAANSTCESDGNTEYWYCTECERFYSDENAEIEITEAETIVKKTGHTYVNHKCTDCDAMEEGYTASGTCGEDITWLLDDDGNLTVTGSGTLVFENGNCPWKDCADKVKTVTLPEGIKNIPDEMFAGCTALTSVIIPSTVESVGSKAFDGCTSLSTAEFLGAAPAFAEDSFNGTTVTAIYSSKNGTWPSDKLKDYGGNVTWKNTAETGIKIESTTVKEGSIVYADGIACTVNADNTISIPKGTSPKVITEYSFHTGSTDVHTQYPTSMTVYIVKTDENGNKTAVPMPSLDNCLQYKGSSIRITGVNGIRMITGVPTSLREALKSGALEGYTLEEYGTLLAWKSDISDTSPLILGQSYVKSNYAYKKGVADPVFRTSDGLTQYTNVITFGNDMSKCVNDLALRPYMKLSKDGEVITIYGGILYRNIGYVAWQNRNAFAKGTDAYNYIWSIINSVYPNGYTE